MPNKEQPFLERMECNTAEEKFEQYCEDRDIKYYKYGIDNHPFESNFWKVNRIVRNTPDYIVMNESPCFIEVKGCKDVIGIKEKDIESYEYWGKQMNLHYFFYSETYNEIKFLSHLKLMELIPMCKTDNYPDANKYDDKLYYKIIWSTI